MREDKFELELACKLTEAETLDRSREMAQSLSTVRDLESQLQSVGAKLRGQIKDVKFNVNRLQKAVLSGCEVRNVLCVERYDLELDQVHTIRLDTQEIVRSRRPEGADRQSPLPMPEGTDNGGDDDPEDDDDMDERELDPEDDDPQDDSDTDLVEPPA